MVIEAVTGHKIDQEGRDGYQDTTDAIACEVRARQQRQGHPDCVLASPFTDGAERGTRVRRAYLPTDGRTEQLRRCAEHRRRKIRR